MEKITQWNKVLFSTSPKEHTVCSFLPRTACRRDTPWTSPTRTKLAENLWNTFERLRATWISVEPRSLLVTRHDPSTFWKIGKKIANANLQVLTGQVSDLLYPGYSPCWHRYTVGADRYPVPGSRSLRLSTIPHCIRLDIPPALFDILWTSIPNRTS